MGQAEAVILVIIAVLTGLLVWGQRMFARPKMRVGGKYRVTKVIDVGDGDTFDVLIHGRHERIRPATYDARERGEAGGAEAAADLKEILRSARSIRFHHVDNDTRKPLARAERRDETQTDRTGVGAAKLLARPQAAGRDHGRAQHDPRRRWKAAIGHALARIPKQKLGARSMTGFSNSPGSGSGARMPFGARRRARLRPTDQG